MNVIKRGAVYSESCKHGSGGGDIGTRLLSLITHGARSMSALFSVMRSPRALPNKNNLWENSAIQINVDSYFWKTTSPT